MLLLQYSSTLIYFVLFRFYFLNFLCSSLHFEFNKFEESAINFFYIFAHKQTKIANKNKNKNERKEKWNKTSCNISFAVLPLFCIEFLVFFFLIFFYFNNAHRHNILCNDSETKKERKDSNFVGDSSYKKTIITFLYELLKYELVDCKQNKNTFVCSFNSNSLLFAQFCVPLFTTWCKQEQLLS